MCEACAEKCAAPLADGIESAILLNPDFVISLVTLHQAAGGEISTLAMIRAFEICAERLRGRLEEVRKTGRKGGKGKKEGKDRTSPGTGVVDAVLDQIVGREWEQQREKGEGGE